MTKRKRLKKREMKEDALVTSALKVSNFVQERFAQVIVGVVVLVAIIAVILFTAQSRRGADQRAESEFSLAMNQYQNQQYESAGTAFANIADQHGGRPSGRMALFFLGETRMAQSRYADAIEAYDRYLDKAGSDGEFAVSAKIAKALCLEGLSEFSRAGELLEGVAAGLTDDDSRYYDILFKAGMFYQQAENRAKAQELFRIVSENATGPIRERAVAWVALMDG